MKEMLVLISKAVVLAIDTISKYEIQSTACFLMAWEQRMVFTFLNDREKSKESFMICGNEMKFKFHYL